MFHELASHNDDLRRLLERGYAVAFDSNHLVVRDIPYLDGEGGLQMGAIVAKLEFIDQAARHPDGPPGVLRRVGAPRVGR